MRVYVLLAESEGWEPSDVVGVYLSRGAARRAAETREPGAAWYAHEAEGGAPYWQSARHRITITVLDLTDPPAATVYSAADPHP